MNEADLTLKLRPRILRKGKNSVQRKQNHALEVFKTVESEMKDFKSLYLEIYDFIPAEQSFSSQLFMMFYYR